MSFLKTDEFEHNGEKIVLSELSALQRLEYLAYTVSLLKEIPEDADDAARMQVMTAVELRIGARLVGQSLWQADIKGPTVEELQQQVLSTWPVTAIGAGSRKVKELSAMLPPEQGEEDEAEDGVLQGPEKSTPVS